MARRLVLPLFFLLAFIALPVSWPVKGSGGSSTYLPFLSTQRLESPVLKWAYGGCYASWCETGWYSSPAVADINGDGKNEVIASAYSLWGLSGETGETLWAKDPPGGRTWPGVVVADIDKDGSQEIVVAQGGGWVSAYTLGGELKWPPRQPAGTSQEFRGLLAADLDNTGAMELVVTRAGGSSQNTWVLDSSGYPRPGWPQLSQTNSDIENGYAWGVYNANAAAGEINSDGRLELIVPSDVHYINAYEPDGSLIPANQSLYPGKYWGNVGVWESLTPELRGWGKCDGVRAESYRTNFADGPAVISDLDGDGSREVVVTGNMVDCHVGYPPSQYMALYIFNADRSRYSKPGADWNTIPVDTGAPLSENYDVIETAEPNPAVADLDGDGRKEILFASYDGKLHAFWLDKTEHGGWPYAVTKPGEGVIQFASEPVIADLQNDGKAEVIFTSWAQKGSYRWGRLHILSWDGMPLFEVNLPAPRSGEATWNGALATPTLANIDGDAELEVIVNTAASGVVAYDLPGTAGARILWGTGRGNYSRTGAQ